MFTINRPDRHRGCHCHDHCQDHCDDDTQIKVELENECKDKMMNCETCCPSSGECGNGCGSGNQVCLDCTGIPIAAEPDEISVQYEKCCDKSGCCGYFPRACRNPFWPSFSKPTWLCCKDLYKR